MVESDSFPTEGSLILSNQNSILQGPEQGLYKQNHILLLEERSPVCRLYATPITLLWLHWCFCSHQDLRTISSHYLCCHKSPLLMSAIPRLFVAQVLNLFSWIPGGQQLSRGANILYHLNPDLSSMSQKHCCHKMSMTRFLTSAVTPSIFGSSPSIGTWLLQRRTKSKEPYLALKWISKLWCLKMNISGFG